jgi:hypothetical protein
MAINIIWTEARLIQVRQQTGLRQAWPSAWYGRSGKLAAEIECIDGYSEKIVSSGDHGMLTLLLLNHSHRPLDSIRFPTRYKTLSEAKQALPLVLDKWENFIPKEFQTRVPSYRASGSVARMYG